MNSLVARLDRIELEIREAALRVGRSAEEVSIIAVSKRQPVSAMLELCHLMRERGTVPVFGENYVQEWARKKTEIPSGTRVHMIGTLQRNKAKQAVQLFDVVESCHSRALLESLNREAQSAQKVQEVFLQVNISEDPAKSGFLLAEVEGAIEAALRLSHLKVSGLMTITQIYDHAEDARPDYKKMREVYDNVLKRYAGSFQQERFELSMGMSGDFQVAVEEGATLVRIGTALFGERA